MSQFEIMRLVLSSVCVVFFIFSSVSRSHVPEEGKTSVIQTGLQVEPTLNDDEELPEDVDFDDDDADDVIKLVDPDGPNIHSLAHLHQKGDEVLVPCFGMWWPVGGGGPAYYYGGDYYGDYRKKRRRSSRKQKKAAKMKRKKS